MTEYIFWISVLALVYTYLGYPAILRILARWWPLPVIKGDGTPSVTFIIVAYNESRVMRRKLENVLSLDYPTDRMEILVGSDASDDGTDEIVRHYADRGVRLVRAETRRGKAHLLNELAALAKGEILVLSDSRQVWESEAVRRLVAPFADPKIGCVSGGLLMGGGGNAAGEGTSFYRRYEHAIRRDHGEFRTMLGATGAIYAIRRCLYEPVPQDTILDDFVIPMNCVLKGYRVYYEPQAIAWEDCPSAAIQEFSRKVRTLAGNYQALTRMPILLIPFKSPVLWQIWSYKVMRLLSPVCLMAAFIACGLLSPSGSLYAGLLVGQATFYSAAVIGLVFPGVKGVRKLAAIPTAFVTMNAAAVVGFYRFIAGTQSVTWRRVG